LRPGPEPIDESFAEQPLDRGLESRVRTLAGKAGMAAEITDRLATAYVTADAAARVEVSRPDQVTGLRRLVLMGPAYHQPTSSVTLGFGDEVPDRHDDMRSPLTLIGVTGEGRLFRRGLYTEEGAPSPREGLRIARHEPDRLLPGIGAADPGLNRYNGAASATVRDAVGEILRNTTSGLTREEKNGLPYRFIMGLEHVTRVRVARRVALARFALNDALDPDLLRLMRGCALQSLREAEWVFGAVRPEPGRPGPGRWFGAPLEELHDRDLSRARVQAIRAYPALAKKLMTVPVLSSAVDDRAPLAPAVASCLRVEEAGVRLLNGVTWQMAGVSPNEPMWGLSRLASVPAELRPARRSEHRQLPLIDGFSDLLKEEFADTMRRFGKGGSPYRFGAELKRVAPSDVRDAAEYLVDKLLLPARRHATRRLCEADGRLRSAPGLDQREAKISDLIRGMPVRDLFELSDRWHRNYERHEDRLVSLRSELSWPPFLEGGAEEGGVGVRELTSAEALQRQGRREGHCVGGYTDKVLRAGPGRITLLFSIERDGEALGTAEIMLRRADPERGQDRSEAPWEAEIVQNRSRHNGPVCAAAERAAERLCRALEQAAPERAEAYIGELKRVRNARSRHGALPEHLRNAGYDLWEPGRLEAAWGELSGYLPRRVRKAGLEALIRTEADRVREGEAPSALPPLHARSAGPVSGDRHAGLLSMLAYEDAKPPFWERDAEAVRRFGSEGGGPEIRRPEPEPDREDEECLPF
jgi:hypothetical protein